MATKILIVMVLITSCVANNHRSKQESSALRQSRMIMKHVEKDEDLQKQLAGDQVFLLQKMFGKTTGCPLSSMKQIDLFKGPLKHGQGTLFYVTFQNQLCSDEVFIVTHLIRNDTMQFETIWHMETKKYPEQKQILLEGY